MLNYTFCFIFFISIPLFAQDTPSIPNIDNLSTTVVFLQTVYPQTVRIDTVTYAVYLKPVNKDTLIPQFRTVSGTGFFVGDSLYFFLVTASHVAADMNANSTVTLKTADDRPISFPLSRFVANHAISWVISK
ncbi:MAG TPA: hypothetical protein VKI62_00790, partial [Bacteroidota bacterium]|nr:hypothetical protein [Bacteroidota bacterium]